MTSQASAESASGVGGRAAFTAEMHMRGETKSNLFPVGFSEMRIVEYYFGLTKGLLEDR